ncbi:hypothetical protein C7444_11930 [Sphaerotilus hippei]|uniref:Uncharacterized protein n=1 Tax=Sphaerotilus hippei TaxID=744406 RepID=A0A318GVI2_9BURK|nr:hypothetical protein [Sphaerotilus hippei]PXW93519.1 hypothetical protein C7444_11930 [Sphaerotilus hippei]
MKLPRRQFLRAFVRWAQHHRADLPFSLRTTLRRDDHLTFTMRGIHPALVLVVGRQEVCVDIHHAGRSWDMLGCFEAVARHRPDGHHCDLCLDQQQTWPTREALWLDHCFEPLAAWMAGPLTSARWLDLCAHEGMTWATLTDADRTPEGLRYRLPVHL